MAIRVGSSTCSAYVNSKKSFLPLFLSHYHILFMASFPFLFSLGQQVLPLTLLKYQMPSVHFYALWRCSRPASPLALSSYFRRPSPTPPLPFSQQTTNVFLVHFELKATPLRFELCRRSTVAGTMIELAPPYFVLNWTSAGTQLHQRSAT